MMKTMKFEQHAAGLRTKRSSEEGFTLIELLIVMSVMLILMTLAVPQLLKLRETGQRDLCDTVGKDHRAGAVAVQLAVPGQWLLVLAGDPWRRSQVGSANAAGSSVDSS